MHIPHNNDKKAKEIQKLIDRLVRLDYIRYTGSDSNLSRERVFSLIKEHIDYTFNKQPKKKPFKRRFESDNQLTDILNEINRISATGRVMETDIRDQTNLIIRLKEHLIKRVQILAQRNYNMMLFNSILLLTTIICLLVIIFNI